jgi:hypothetical protein
LQEAFYSLDLVHDVIIQPIEFFSAQLIVCLPEAKTIFAIVTLSSFGNQVEGGPARAISKRRTEVMNLSKLLRYHHY